MQPDGVIYTISSYTFCQNVVCLFLCQYYQYCGNIINIVAILSILWQYYQYCGNIINFVAILSILWQYYQYFGNIINIVAILSIFWQYYQYCGNIIHIVAILSILWQYYRCYQQHKKGWPHYRNSIRRLGFSDFYLNYSRLYCKY